MTRDLICWADNTTLYSTLYDGDSQQSPILGRGILIIHPEDFLRQLTTMQVTNAATPEQQLEAKVRFGRFFTGVCLTRMPGSFPRSSRRP